MQICEKQYQSLNISASPSFVTAQGRENERRGWTKETYDAKNKEPGNRYDWSRRHLNFEIKRGKEMGRINGKPIYARPTIIPLGTQEKPLKGGYDLDPDIEPDGKERPKHIITRQYERLSEEEKRFYKPAVKKKVPMVSYAHYFGKTKYQAYTSYKHWHTMLYEEVNSKWGLARGEDTSLMTPEERKEHRKKSKRKLEQERLEALRKTLWN